MCILTESLQMTKMMMYLTALAVTLLCPSVQPYMVYKESDLDVQPYSSSCCDLPGTQCGSSGSNCFFRYLAPIGEDTLYVGAMNNILKFNISGNKLDFIKKEELLPDSESNRKCKIQGKSDYPECQNHIRVVMETSSSQMFVCGTGGYSPTNYFLMPDLASNDTPAKEIGMCPYDPFDNATALQVASGNAGNVSVMYFGTYTDFNKNFPVFVRPKYTGTNSQGVTTQYAEKTTDIEEPKWLYSPQFVGTFDVDNEIFLFFREKSIEYMDRKDKIYARVGKVCKKDISVGPMDASKPKWLSFQKSRLVCYLPGESPYFFDDLYDVYHVPGEEYFFGLFYKQGAGLNASAICMYSKANIRASFNGKFKYKTSNGVWETLPDNLNPNPRLDNCTQHDLNSSAFTRQSLQYLLMDTNVEPVFGKPIKYIHGVQLLRLVVAKTMEYQARNIYAASSDGKVYEFFFKTDDNVTPRKFTIYESAIHMPFGDMESPPIWDMKLVKSAGIASLVLGTDSQVVKFRVDNCTKIKNLNTCLLNMYCVLHCNRTCIAKVGSEGLCVKNQSIIELDKNIILSLQAEDIITPSSPVDQMGYIGLYTTLKINVRVAQSAEATWKKNHLPVAIENSDKYALTFNNDLVIKSLHNDDDGNYAAVDSHGVVLANYTLTVKDGADNNKLVEQWKQEFIDWSGSYKTWKHCSSNYLESCPKPGS